MDIYEGDHELILAMEVPGLNGDNLEINTTKNTISIAGEFKQPELPGQVQAIRQERGYGRFSRSFHLPLPVDSDKASFFFTTVGCPA